MVSFLMDIGLLGRVLANTNLDAQGSAYSSYNLVGTKK